MEIYYMLRYKDVDNLSGEEIREEIIESLKTNRDWEE
jgi:ribosomal protein S24E